MRFKDWNFGELLGGVLFVFAILLALAPILSMLASYIIAFAFGCNLPTGTIDGGDNVLTCSFSSAPVDLIGIMYRSHILALISLPIGIGLAIAGALIGGIGHLFRK